MPEGWDAHVSGESREERFARLRDELGDIARRVAEIEQELEEEDPAGETPEQRRRKLRVIGGGGGAAGIAAFMAVPRAWARGHGRALVGSAAAAAGGAVITAAVFSHPAAYPHTVPIAPFAPPIAPTASIAPPGGPTSHPHRRRIPLPPPVIFPTRRRGNSAAAIPSPMPSPPLGELPLLPSAPFPSVPPLPVPSLSLLPTPVLPSPTASRSCARADLSVTGRILICL